MSGSHIRKPATTAENKNYCLRKPQATEELKENGARRFQQKEKILQKAIENNK